MNRDLPLNVQQLLITYLRLNDNKIKRRDAPYTTVAVKDVKSVFCFFFAFFFRSTPCLFLEVHQVNCPAAQMVFLKTFEKIHRVIPRDLPEKMAFFSEFFHLMFFQLTLGNLNVQSSSQVIFKFSFARNFGICSSYSDFFLLLQILITINWSIII